MKLRLLVVSCLLLGFTLVGCNDSNSEITSSEILEDYYCKNTPFAEGCYSKIDGPVISEDEVTQEIVFNETFKEDMIDSQPFSWLLFRSDIYEVDTVEAKVKSNIAFNIPTDNKVLSLYSKGDIGPLYSPTYLTLIFTREFNLDAKGYGVAEATILLPNEQSNEINFEVVTGSANVIGVRLNSNNQGNVSVIAGDQFHYYQGTTIIQSTNVTLQKDTWYTFRLEWNCQNDEVKAFIYDNETGSLNLLYSGNFHQSVRFNAKKSGAPIPPNHVRLSMPFNPSKNGYAFIDSVKVNSTIDESLFNNPNVFGGN